MRDPNATESPSSFGANGSASVHPLVRWLGWTTLWLVVTAVLGRIAWSSESGWTSLIPPFAALVVGMLCRRWSFLLAPLSAGISVYLYVIASSIRGPDPAFARDGGYEIVKVVVAAGGAGSVIAAAIGVGIGSMAFPRATAPVSAAPRNGNDRRRPHDVGHAETWPVPDGELAPSDALPEEWPRPFPRNPVAPTEPKARLPE